MMIKMELYCDDKLIGIYTNEDEVLKVAKELKQDCDIKLRVYDNIGKEIDCVWYHVRY